MFQFGEQRFTIALMILSSEIAGLIFTLACWFMNDFLITFDVRYIALVLNPILISVCSLLSASYLFRRVDDLPKRKSKKIGYFIVMKIVFGLIFFSNLFILWSYQDITPPRLTENTIILCTISTLLSLFLLILYETKQEQESRAVSE